MVGPPFEYRGTVFEGMFPYSDGGLLDYKSETGEKPAAGELIDACPPEDGFVAAAGRRKPQTIDRRPRLLILHDEREKDQGLSHDSFLPLAKAAEDIGFIVRNLDVSTVEVLRRTLREFSPDLLACASFPQDEDFMKSTLGLLEGAHAAWIGPSPLSLWKTRNLPAMKTELEARKIPVSKWQVIHPDPEGEIQDLAALEGLVDYPYTIRPVLRSGGREGKGETAGFSGELYYAVRAYCERKQDALIEQVNAGPRDSRFFSVSMLGTGEASIIAPVEVTASADGQDKHLPLLHDEDVMFLQVQDETAAGKATKLARRAFETLGARDYARFLIEKKGDDLIVLDVDSQPDILDEGYWHCFSPWGVSRDTIASAVLYACLVARASEGKAFISALIALRKNLSSTLVDRLEPS